MGVAYAQDGFSVKLPRVGLLNVGTELHKGSNELHEASLLIKVAEQDLKSFKFLGYVEGGDLPSPEVDIIVTDGFTGNVALKTGEGTASLIKDFLKEALNQSLMAKVGSFLSLSSLKKLNQRIDPRNVNGGIFLGLNGIVIKSHGGADAIGVAAAINLARQLAKSELSAKLSSQFSKLHDS
jgi:glycerol-3-phosphate acyltransferase PlsX